MKKLKKEITKRGYSIAGFAEVCLGLKYHTFSYKCRTGSFDFEEIAKMIKMLDIKFEDLLSS